VYQTSRHLSKMQTMNCTRFVLEKATFWTFWKAIGRWGAPLHCPLKSTTVQNRGALVKRLLL